MRLLGSVSGHGFRPIANNFVLPALTVPKIHIYRRQVELFFKWIKRHPWSKAFSGSSENARKTPI